MWTPEVRREMTKGNNAQEGALATAATKLLEHELQRLSAAAGPALLVDVPGARLLGANAAALTLLGLNLGQGLPPDGLPLDRATPALATLAHGAPGPPTPGAEPVPLVFWIDKPRLLMLRTAPVAGFGSGIVRLSAEPASGSGVVPASSSANDGADGGGDMRTMALIARRIREGLGEGAAPFAVRTTSLPPPLAGPASSSPDPPSGPDHRRAGHPLEADAAGDTGDVSASRSTADGAGAAEPGWPGLRVLSDRDLATLAHELRTPLAAIVALAEAVREQAFGPLGHPKYIEYAGDIHASAGHALELLDATIGGEPAPSKVVPTDVNALILSTTSALQPLAARAGVALATSLAAGLPPLLVDARTIRQILLNLVSNALRHTPPGGEVTLFTAYRVDGPVRIEVRDTGAGISAEDLSFIEGEIEADRNGLPPGPHGGGLGLPLVRRLAAVNGAELGLDTRPGEGTRVFLTFGRDRVTEGF